MFAQLIHEGDWDPDPSAVHNLLKFARDNSTLDVKFKRENVQPDDPKVATHPLLYITGHYEFAWTADEAAALRRYLKAGGLLLADACCGRLAFDAAFRREIAKVLPDNRLERLPAEHPIYHSLHDIKQVEYTPRVREDFGPLERAGTGRHHARRPAGGHLQPLRPGQRLGAIPARLQLRAEGRVGAGDRGERVGVRGNALEGRHVSRRRKSNPATRPDAATLVAVLAADHHGVGRLRRRSASSWG